MRLSTGSYFPSWNRVVVLVWSSWTVRLLTLLTPLHGQPRHRSHVFRILSTPAIVLLYSNNFKLSDFNTISRHSLVHIHIVIYTNIYYSSSHISISKTESIYIVVVIIYILSLFIFIYNSLPMHIVNCFSLYCRHLINY